MNKEIIVSKDSITIPCVDTVTIPRCEYNDLIAAKTINDMILAVSSFDGYGCSDIVIGMRALDKYRSALSESEDRLISFQNDRDAQVAELNKAIADLKGQLKEALGVNAVEITPEETADA